MKQLAARFTGYWTAKVKLQDKPLAAPEPVFGAPRPLTGFFAGLSADQKKLALAYCGEESHGDPAFLLRKG